MSLMFATEHDFTLPMGFLDADGTLHRDGVMRLATAADEILPLHDPRVQRNPAYLTVILLSRVVTRLGSVDPITPKTIEGLFAADLAYLQDLYNEINARRRRPAVACPAMRPRLRGGARPPGGVRGYPLDQLIGEVAFIAYHFHWPHDDVDGARARRPPRWVEEISAINERIGAA